PLGVGAVGGAAGAFVAACAYQDQVGVVGVVVVAGVQVHGWGQGCAVAQVQGQRVCEGGVGVDQDDVFCLALVDQAGGYGCAYGAGTHHGDLHRFPPLCAVGLGLPEVGWRHALWPGFGRVVVQAIGNVFPCSCV